MTSANIDSVAVFEARLMPIGVLDRDLTILLSKCWNTYGALPFVAAYVAGAPDEILLVVVISKNLQC